jgi:hypothetical protein
MSYAGLTAYPIFAGSIFQKSNHELPQARTVVCVSPTALCSVPGDRIYAALAGGSASTE